MNARLYMMPGSCARVTAIALEEAGQPFETEVVRFMTGEHKSPEYRKLNPKGKVPTLVFEGEVLTENVAIVLFLNERFPDARLMPAAANALERARLLADLCFCSATLHPLVTRIRVPQFFASEDALSSVWSLASAAMTECFQMVENRLRDGPWWYGDDWSAMDGYLYWVYWRVAGADFDTGPFPRYTDHAARIQSRPAVRRALAREEAAIAQLKAEGLELKPPPPPGTK